jgi:dienelactone hydrolase
LLAGAGATADTNVTIEAKLPSGKLATASYQRGQPDRPAVLLLHGFLQTRNFPTVASAGDALATAGYSVLMPTLSLGISRRNQSLPCEAVHTHSLQEDVAELGYWTRWLADRGHTQIVLVGHSFGSVQILSYLNGKPAPAVAKAILISLTDVEVKQDANQRAKLAASLRERATHNAGALAEAEFGHCKKYVAPTAALLSYLSITRESILVDLRKPPVPVEVLLGSADDRMGADWAAKLRERGVTVTMIGGANHFFDNQHEFDLQDALLQSLKGLPPRNAKR